MRHAFLIMAHDRPSELSDLIQSLDDSDHCIYLHIDARSRLNPNDFRSCAEKSPLIAVKQHAITWGGVSQIAAEMELFSTAYHDGGFGYYHLMSGVGCVTHSNEYLHKYFNKYNGENFIKLSPTPNRLVMRYDQYHWFHEKLVGKKRNMWKYVDFALCYLQQIFGVSRFHGIEIPKHQTWCSLTSDFVSCLVSDKEKILRQFKYTYCCDEIFLTYELCGHGMWDTLSSHGSLRFIEWTQQGKRDSSPRALTIQDFDRLAEPNILFARKINYPESSSLVEKLEDFRGKNL